MRLIDADELKKYFPNGVDWEYPVNTNEYVCECIDNVPTVEPICNQIAWEQGYEAGVAQGKSERPQDEWIDYDNTFYKCPDCGYLLEKCCPQCQNKVILPKGGAE